MAASRITFTSLATLGHGTENEPWGEPWRRAGSAARIARSSSGEPMIQDKHLDDAIARAARAVASAEAILIGAGAGMGVDSGLPDFRGGSGFWKAYPRYAKLGLQFTAIANPRWFSSDP